MKKREKASKMIFIAGLAFCLPFELVVGPLIGYFVGDFLKKKFHLNSFILYVMVLLGFIWSLNNAIYIIRRMIRINQNK